ncbi:DNA recombination/repair Rad51-like protein [Penicillium ucsense]|uniref:DNA repair protein RAD51 homolog 3 n=1 Tax=Penicillium ucsense TaxID=2839758 RepID=A0A8J8W3M1_9EURO|nr:DNA recombination/repair Rad51-like protein [Penicillium ucsense]KAF7739617.1 DNA recombination/repair Rad51-like protein [Penicillium ucsense]
MSINKDLLGLDGLDTLPVISISASQSLNASAAVRESISTGLPRLNEALDDFSMDEPRRSGGIVRGHVTEVFGPPGAGKTSFALSAASQALRDGGKVVWVDTGSPLATSRLESITPHLNNLIYFRAPTLPHLLALLIRPPKEFPPPETTLLIIDSISSLFPAYFLSASELKDRLAQGKIPDKPQLQWLLNRKWNVIGDIATHLTRLAARNIAVLALNQTHTKIKGQPRATLHPVVAGGTWETNVQTRIVLYRDLPDLRFAEVTKRAGRMMAVRLAELIVPFRVCDGGLEAVDEPSSPDHTAPTPTRKRKADNEVADSQDEDSEEEFEWLNDTSLDDE